MSTLCGLSSKYANYPADKKGVFHAHLTLLDIHAATIARDLCVFLLLGELAWHTVGAATAMEIKATLMYIYCGVVMPSYCYARYVLRSHDAAVSIHSLTISVIAGSRGCFETCDDGWHCRTRISPFVYMSPRTLSPRYWPYSTSG